MKKVARQVKKNMWRVFYELDVADYAVGCCICLALMIVIRLVYGA